MLSWNCLGKFQNKNILYDLFGSSATMLLEIHNGLKSFADIDR